MNSKRVCCPGRSSRPHEHLNPQSKNQKLSSSRELKPSHRNKDMAIIIKRSFFILMTDHQNTRATLLLLSKFTLTNTDSRRAIRSEQRR